MSKFFLASRSFILLALIVLIIASIWGWANRTDAPAFPEQSQVEKYPAKKPGPATTYFFNISIFLGVLIIGFSIWLEYKRVQDLANRPVEREIPEPLATCPTTGDDPASGA